MPFVRNDQGEIRWARPGKDDVQIITQGIRDAASTGEVIELDDDRLSAIVASVLPVQTSKALRQANVHSYKAIRNLVTGEKHPVDIIMPVYNSIHLVHQAIEAVLRRTDWPFRLTIVNDASDEATSEILEHYADTWPSKVTVIHNASNRGFASTVNRGIRSTNNPYIVLLNSDVLVTQGWLTKMLMALESDPRNQIVNPVTNNTAMIAVPMAQGCSYLAMNRVFEEFSQRRYPEIIPTGFCFLFPRSLVDQIGEFDESYENFGEETDFWMRTVNYVHDKHFPHYRAVLADDTFVFHERGTSFSILGEVEHQQLRNVASARFHHMWPKFRPEWGKAFDPEVALGPLKRPIPSDLIVQEGQRRICWVVHDTRMCGGMKYIADIINSMVDEGYDARVALVARDPKNLPSVLPEIRTAPILFNSIKEFEEEFDQRVFSHGVVVASTAELAGSVKRLTDRVEDLTPLLHVQSYEPELTDDPALQASITDSFKLIPNIISSSNWITEKLKELQVPVLATISPGVDQYLFYPRDRESGDERPTVMFSLIPTYPFKGAERGVETIKHLLKRAKKENMDIRVMAYGVDVIKDCPNVVCLGSVRQGHLAKQLANEVDVFVDPAHNHSYGMPALEALASGCEVVCWNNKGIIEYMDDKTTVMEADLDPEAASTVILQHLKNRRSREVSEPIQYEHNRIMSVVNFVCALDQHLFPGEERKKIVVTVPHLRKHGGPTSILEYATALQDLGHDVSILCILREVHPEVVKKYNLPIFFEADSLPDCDILITFSDCEQNAMFSTTPKAKKKVLLKLSHNERFLRTENDSLNMKWDKVITSTDELARKCAEVQPGWKHPEIEAERIGWWHYGHTIFDSQPDKRSYGDGVNVPIVISTLIHRHPLKGTNEALSVLEHILAEQEYEVRCVGIGEVPKWEPPLWMKNNYLMNLSRKQLAEVLGKSDIWLSASHTEGLGRMALEAMSAGVACVLSDTGAEYAVHEENCLLYPVGDLDGMKDAIKRLIEEKELRRKIVVNGYKTALASAAQREETLNNLDRMIRGLFRG